MPVAAFRLTGSVSGFHDSALVSVMVHVTPDAPNSPAPSMARERLCWARWTGPTNGRRVSGVMSLPVHLADSVCGAVALLRADRPVTPIHSLALVDLVGRVPGAPPE